MKIHKTLLTIGLLVIIIPYTGFPPAWKTGFLVFLGVFLVVLSGLIKIKKIHRAHFEEAHNPEVFEEHVPHVSDAGASGASVSGAGVSSAGASDADVSDANVTAQLDSNNDQKTEEK